jgi:hypothetical protein
MARRAWMRRYALALIVAVAAGSGAIITSCGSGGGDGGSNGDLCEQCGSTDGPCMASTTASGEDAQALCDVGVASCSVELACLRELGSAQRRCFPNSGRNVELFECDDERAQRGTPTATPTLSATPTPTFTPASTETPPSSGSPSGATPTTPTPSTAATPQATATSAGELCGNNIVEGDEECDGADLDDDTTCEDVCEDAGGTLACNSNCTFNFSGCSNPPCEAP